jgi:hypothetical protein
VCDLLSTFTTVLTGINSIFFSTNMARKKPIVPLRRHYSHDLKHRVIYQSQVLGLKSTEVAINLDIPVRVVQRVKRVWNEIGEVFRDRHAARRAPLMRPEHCEVCFSLNSLQNHHNHSFDICYTSD